MTAEWEREAAQRAAANRGAPTLEDEILRALLARTPERLTEAARLRALAQLIDHDYLAYWVDELRLQGEWRALERLLGSE